MVTNYLMNTQQSVMMFFIIKYIFDVESVGIINWHLLGHNDIWILSVNSRPSCSYLFIREYILDNC